MKKCSVLLITALLLVASSQASYTVATFANPSPSGFEPLFYVDWDAETLNGGWDNGDLTLIFGTYFGGASFDDVRFEMESVEIVDQAVMFGKRFGQTGQGEINFYAQLIPEPILTISFFSAIVDNGSFWSDDATISSPLITDLLIDEQFSFSFAGKQDISGGFSVTAAFNSSAIPEPATMTMFGIGAALAFVRRKRS